MVFTGIANITNTPIRVAGGGHKVTDKDCVHAENSQMASNGVIFSSTYHTKHLNPWPNSSASRVVNYSWPSACPREVEPFNDHLNTRGCLISLGNKPQQKQPEQFSAPIPA